MAVDVEKNRANVRRWYRNNAEAYNKKRREKYKEDVQVREKARLSSQKYRERKRITSAPITRQLTRMINGLEVLVFSTGQVAERFNISAQVLRNWHVKGWIPDPTVPGKHKVYLGHQVDLIGKLCAEIKDAGGAAKIEGARLSEVLESIKGHWNAG